jgi:hypothetical protein
MSEKTCYKCCCVDTEENPIFEILDDGMCVDEWVCMMCFVEEMDKDDG